MSNPALKMLDATIHRQLAAAGLAEGPTQAQYIAVDGGAAVPVRVYVDRSMQQAGDYGTNVAPRTIIGILREDVSDPRAGALLIVEGEEGPETFELEAKAETQDESISRWVVAHG